MFESFCTSWLVSGCVATASPATAVAGRTPLGAAGRVGEPPHAVSRRYQPVHNVGHFRYLEASHINGDDQPAGDYTVWDEVLFPSTPYWPINPRSTRFRSCSERAAIQEVEEVYECDWPVRSRSAFTPHGALQARTTGRYAKPAVSASRGAASRKKAAK